MSKKKIFGLAVLAVLVVLVAVAAVAKVISDNNYFDGYDPSAPLNAQVTDVQEKDGYTRTALSFIGWRGERVPTVMLIPKDAAKPVPCVIFLHGIGQSKNFVDEELDGWTIATPFLKAGYAFVSFDQYTRGERKLKDASPLQEAEAFRLRPAYTVNDTRRLIDFLQTQPEISPHRIYLAGASYGAITGSTVAAFDKRIQAVALCYGGGDMCKLMTAPAILDGLKESIVPLPVVQFLSWYFMSASDPVKYVAQIAPRPVFLQNGTNDSLIATEAAKALQEAAAEPKTIKWYEGDHIGTDPATVKTALDDILTFFQEQERQP